MKKLFSFIVFFIAVQIPHNNSFAVTTDAIVLKGVEVKSSNIEGGEKIELVLEFEIPKYFDWNPAIPSTGGYVNALYCPKDNLDGFICSFPKTMSFYRIQTIEEFTTLELDNSKIVLLRISGIIDEGSLGEFYLYSIRVSGADLPYRDEVHVYFRNKNYAEEALQPRTDIPVPDMPAGDIKVVLKIEALPVDEILEDNNTVEEEIVIPNTSTPPATIQRTAARTVQVAPVVAPAIQSNFFLPAIKGDQYWRPLREVKGSFENWRVGKRNSLDGVSNRFTKTNGSLMTFTTTGDAVSVRYLAGKKRGGFSIYVNGQFLDRVYANQKRKKTLVKTWDGLGDGKHYIDIVAELSNDQSLAINGVQKLKK